MVFLHENKWKIITVPILPRVNVLLIEGSCLRYVRHDQQMSAAGRSINQSITKALVAELLQG